MLLITSSILISHEAVESLCRKDKMWNVCSTDLAPFKELVVRAAGTQPRRSGSS
jgi:hypothetical protein